METKLRKIGLLAGVVCTSLFGFALTADDYESTPAKGCPQPCPNQPHGTYQRGTYREILPNAGPRVCYGADVFLIANFIYWNAVQEGTTFAYTGITTAAANADAPKGKAAAVGKDWSPGFKVALGLNLSQDGWDILARYTWLQPSNSETLSSTNGVTPEQISSFVTNNGTLTSAQSKWSLHFNVIDVELGRNCYFSQFLAIRPFVGLKGTWQEQHTVTKYIDNGGFTYNNSSYSGPYRVKNHLENWGIGMRGGFNTNWYLVNNFCIVGRLAWTAMWTDYNEISEKDTLFNTNSAAIVLSNVRGKGDYPIRHVTECEIGLCWETWFSDDNYHFAIQAGWEEQIWINWAGNEIINPNRGFADLSFHGLTLDLRFDF